MTTQNCPHHSVLAHSQPRGVTSHAHAVTNVTGDRSRRLGDNAVQDTTKESVPSPDHQRTDSRCGRRHTDSQYGRRHTPSVVRHTPSVVRHTPVWHAPVLEGITTTGPRSAVVSASDCGSEGLGFESHQSHVGFFSPGRLLPSAGSAMGPVGRLEPHSRASSTSPMRL